VRPGEQGCSGLSELLKAGLAGPLSGRNIHKEFRFTKLLHGERELFIGLARMAIKREILDPDDLPHPNHRLSPSSQSSPAALKGSEGGSSLSPSFDSNTGTFLSRNPNLHRDPNLSSRAGP